MQWAVLYLVSGQKFCEVNSYAQIYLGEECFDLVQYLQIA